MAFLQERSQIKQNEEKLGRKVQCRTCVMFLLKTLNFTERNLKKVPFKVQSCIDGGLDNDLIDPDNRENIAQRKRQNLRTVLTLLM